MPGDLCDVCVRGSSDIHFIESKESTAFKPRDVTIATQWLGPDCFAWQKCSPDRYLSHFLSRIGSVFMAIAGVALLQFGPSLGANLSMTSGDIFSLYLAQTLFFWYWLLETRRHLFVLSGSCCSCCGRAIGDSRHWSHFLLPACRRNAVP